MLGRHYYGTDIACDCLGIYSRYIRYNNTMNVGAVCTYNETRYGCD